MISYSLKSSAPRAPPLQFIPHGCFPASRLASRLESGEEALHLSISFASHRQGDDASASKWAWFAWRLGASTASLVTLYISGPSVLEKRPAPILFSQYTIHEEKGTQHLQT